MNTKKEVVIAPVLQLKKENYCFRPEVSKLLEENSIDMNELSDSINMYPFGCQYNCIVINDWNCEKKKADENDKLLKLTSYVQISKYREKTLKSIGDDVKIPTNIAKDSGIRTNHISKVLSELKSKEIVECINEEARKGRLYRLTETGKDVLNTIKVKEKKEEK